MRGVIVFAVALGATACTLLVKTSDLDDGSADASTLGAPLGDANVPSNPDGNTTQPEGGKPSEASVPGCPSGGGPTMVDTGVLCIDSTEVTRGQYGAFLATNPPVSLMDASRCAQNFGFTPDNANDCQDYYSSGAKGDYPMGCIDWCAASGFCAWAGKRLCTDDEWVAVCTNNGAQKLPYAGPFDESKCNGANKGNGGPIPVASLASCEGGAKGVFDMVGNLTELTSSCTPDGNCTRRGGSYDPSSEPKCDFNLASDVKFDEPFVGFRCCADRK